MYDENCTSIPKPVVAAVIATLAGVSLAAQPGEIIDGEVVISTSGATALGAFTRMNERSGTGSDAPSSGTVNYGPLSLGLPSLTIGSITYNLPTNGTVQYLGQKVAGVQNSFEPGNGNARLRYHYLESGSIQGILDLVDSNGLLLSNPAGRRPKDPSSNLFLWVNGNRYTAPNTTGEYTANRTVGQNYSSFPGSPTTPQTGQPKTRIAWSDVRFEQGFSIEPTAGSGISANRKPTEAGYGRGPTAIGLAASSPSDSRSFQQLRKADVIEGGIDPATTRLRNEALAVVPFNLVANPGTGLAKVTKDEGKWLQATGRLANGANFNSVTREIGSGTRNQGDLNLGLDPSFGGGERDRRLTAASPVTMNDNNDVAVTVLPGGEISPSYRLNGTQGTERNENRVGKLMRFSDKTSGSSGVRATVVASRMGIGILSAGDSRSGGSGSALAVHQNGAAPMRALAIDFGNGSGYVQATAANVTSGAYQMWSASQAITVAPYANPTANDTGANAYKPIAGDYNDIADNNITSSAQTGIHRKFIDNITGSVGTYNAGATSTSAITPADFIVFGSFIPPQIMGVTKEFDGGTQTPRTRNAVDPDGTGPLISEQELYNRAVGAANGELNIQTQWGNPSATNGGITNGSTASAVKYRIFASTNNSSSAVENRRIDITTRTNLVGDFNGDSVRDLKDTEALAMAYADTNAYLATGTSGGSLNALGETRSYNGLAVQTRTVTDANGPALRTGENAATSDGLIVLSDFDSDGNVTNDVAGNLQTAAITRKDVRYFLTGATVDTTGIGDYTTAAGQAAKREDGVRMGVLKKNAAMDRFNAELDDLASDGIITTTTANTLKISKYDVDQDDSVTLRDAAIVDRFVGKNFTNLDHQLEATVSVTVSGYTYQDSFNLVMAELEDDADGSIRLSDFQMIKIATGLGDGDANFDGDTDGDDIGAWAANFTGELGLGSLTDLNVRKWSTGDFDLDGDADGDDASIWAAAFTGELGGIPPQLLTIDLGTMYGSTAPAALGILENMGFTVIPEPASLSLLGVAAGQLLRRRRRA
jgi:hypothetical protein